MKAVRLQGTAAELALRQALDVYDLKYSVNSFPLANLQRQADISFDEEMVAVFVDGCFWHGCPIHGTHSKSHARLWSEKIERNKLRDRDTDRKLAKAGWKVVRIWEHEDPNEASHTILDVLERVRIGKDGLC